jgi:methionyl-tRNA formyltransferase
MNSDKQTKLRAVFMGTPEFVLPVLEKTYAHPNIELVAVYTQPPRPKARGNQVQFSPVHAWAESKNIPAKTPLNFKNELDVTEFQHLNIDVAVVAGYGLLLPKSILNVPKYGCVNVHPSLLPRWRGPAPVQYAIWQGDAQTGVCIMQLDAGMDTGPIISHKIFDMAADETTTTLNAKVWQMGADMLYPVLSDMAKGKTITPMPQSMDGVTYSKMFKKEDAKINWCLTAKEIDQQIRALNPWPSTYCMTENGQRLKILSSTCHSDASHRRAEESQSQKDRSFAHAQDDKIGTVLDKHGLIQCGQNTVLKIITLQPDNKKPMDFASALNGGYIKIGDKLS